MANKLFNSAWRTMWTAESSRDNRRADDKLNATINPRLGGSFNENHYQLKITIIFSKAVTNGNNKTNMAPTQPETRVKP